MSTTITTEAEARPYYGRRVWLVDPDTGARVRRTIVADDRPAGDGRTMGEYWNRVILKARTAAHLASLDGGLTIEVKS